MRLVKGKGGVKAFDLTYNMCRRIQKEVENKFSGHVHFLKNVSSPTVQHADRFESNNAIFFSTHLDKYCMQLNFPVLSHSHFKAVAQRRCFQRSQGRGAAQQ